MEHAESEIQKAAKARGAANAVNVQSPAGTAAEISAMKEKHKKIFGVDLGAELADPFVEGLYQKICDGNGAGPQSVGAHGSQIFMQLAQHTYGPIMWAFVDWVLISYAMSGKAEKGGKICFMARDSIPLFRMAQVMVQESDYGLTQDNLSLVYFTRKIAGEADEIAGFGNSNISESAVQEYLAQCGVDGNALIVDMGLYGSLYNKGCSQYWQHSGKPGVVFFYSKNPNILGFINLVQEFVSVHGAADLGNKLVDGFECVNPQTHWSPGSLQRINGVLAPQLNLIDDSYVQQWSAASLFGYVQCAQHSCGNGGVNVAAELAKLQNLSQLAIWEVWTGVLPHITPEWSLKDPFLSNTPEFKLKTGKEGWTAGVAPPLGTVDIVKFMVALQGVLKNG